jgi:hypothetical protein
MIAAGKMYLVRAPHLTLFPGLAITMTVFGLNLLADALRDIMDVKLLASYIGLPRWKVRRHLSPSGFAKLEETVLRRYAEIFRIPVEGLTNFREKSEKE